MDFNTDAHIQLATMTIFKMNWGIVPIKWYAICDIDETYMP